MIAVICHIRSTPWFFSLDNNHNMFGYFFLTKENSAVKKNSKI